MNNFSNIYILKIKTNTFNKYKICRKENNLQQNSNSLIIIGNGYLNDTKNIFTSTSNLNFYCRTNESLRNRYEILRKAIQFNVTPIEYLTRNCSIPNYTLTEYQLNYFSYEGLSLSRENYIVAILFESYFYYLENIYNNIKKNKDNFYFELALSEVPDILIINNKTSLKDVINNHENLNYKNIFMDISRHHFGQQEILVDGYCNYSYIFSIEKQKQAANFVLQYLKNKNLINNENQNKDINFQQPLKKPIIIPVKDVNNQNFINKAQINHEAPILKNNPLSSFKQSLSIPEMPNVPNTEPSYVSGQITSIDSKLNQLEVLNDEIGAKNSIDSNNRLPSDFNQAKYDLEFGEIEKRLADLIKFREDLENERNSEIEKRLNSLKKFNQEREKIKNDEIEQRLATLKKFNDDLYMSKYGDLEKKLAELKKFNDNLYNSKYGDLEKRLASLKKFNDELYKKNYGDIENRLNELIKFNNQIAKTNYNREIYANSILNNNQLKHDIFHQRVLTQIKKEDPNKLEIKRAKRARDLRNKDFSNQYLNGIDLSNADLTNANFNNSILRNVNFNNSVLSWASFNKTVFKRSSLWNCELDNTDLDNAIFYYDKMSVDEILRSPETLDIAARAQKWLTNPSLLFDSKECGYNVMIPTVFKLEDIKKPGLYRFVILPNGEIKIGLEDNKKNDIIILRDKFGREIERRKIVRNFSKDGKIEICSHAGLCNNQRVIAAGSFEIGDYIISINNSSGHYKPNEDSLFVAAKIIRHKYPNLIKYTRIESLSFDPWGRPYLRHIATIV